MRKLKVIIVLGVLGFAALAGFAYLGDYAPEPATTRSPVTLNGG